MDTTPWTVLNCNVLKKQPIITESKKHAFVCVRWAANNDALVVMLKRKRDMPT